MGAVGDAVAQEYHPFRTSFPWKSQESAEGCESGVPPIETAKQRSSDADLRGSSSQMCSRYLPNTPLKFHFQTD